MDDGRARTVSLDGQHDLPEGLRIRAAVGGPPADRRRPRKSQVADEEESRGAQQFGPTYDGIATIMAEEELQVHARVVIGAP
jgi:hypothetical protein